MFSVLQGFPLVGLAALGLAVTIVAGELDLSVGSMAALAAVIAVETSALGLVGCLAVATAACIISAAYKARSSASSASIRWCSPSAR